MMRARRTVPTKLAALAVGVPEATIRQWTKRGKLNRFGTPRRAEYDIEELRVLATLRADAIAPPGRDEGA